MAIKEKRNEISLKGKRVCIGIDMHKHFWRVTAMLDGHD